MLKRESHLQMTRWELWKLQGYAWVGNWQQHLPKPVTQDLARILDKLLQVEHQQRYESAAAVLQLISCTRTHKAITIQNPK
ncbi:phosphate transporter binding protein [Nostoc sp. NIES-4103]|nr:phosphate transporter binding protein [Nostoc sp. NIES-4103]